MDGETRAQGWVAMAGNGAQALKECGGSFGDVGVVCAGKRTPGVAERREGDLWVRGKEARLDLCAGTIGEYIFGSWLDK